MTLNEKNSLINEIIELLQAKIVTAPVKDAASFSPQSVELLTIPECLEVIKGLSEHTLRLFVAQNKIPYIRVGEGKRGKILINKKVGV